MIEQIIRKGYEDYIYYGDVPKERRRKIGKYKRNYTRTLYYNRDSKCICAELFCNGELVKSVGSKTSEKVKYAITMTCSEKKNELLSMTVLGGGMLSFKYTGDIFNFRRITHFDFNVEDLEPIKIHGGLVFITGIEIF